MVSNGMNIPKQERKTARESLPAVRALVYCDLGINSDGMFDFRISKKSSLWRIGEESDDLRSRQAHAML